MSSTKEMKKYNIPVFIPHRGCQNDCLFCNQKKITGIETDVSPEYVKELIEKSLLTMDENYLAEVAFFGGSFTGLKKEVQEDFLSVAAAFYPEISGVRISTRADYIDEDVLKLLKKYNVTSIELGVQSTDDEVLKKNFRGHSFSDVQKAAKLINEWDFELGLQMMLGMFGSDFEKDLKTADDIISLNPKTTRIYPTVVLKGTKLEEYYNEGIYKPYSLEEAVLCAKEVYLKFKQNDVKVLRVGLHSSKELDLDGALAGPYHPAFGEMVFSLILRDEIEDEIIKKGYKDLKLDLMIKKNSVSKAVGQKKSNLVYFKDKYNIDISIKEMDTGKDKVWILQK